ncbi:MAG: GNAT family N-acetyltransferase [Oscillospiraceae bacterium]|nr:GNAT family N-acetyltransferase [Oscillospiraceae bacterium]
MVYELKDPSKAAPLFTGQEDLDTGVIACLDNVMGKILVTDPEHPRSALAVIGDFVFCAGRPDLELLRSKPDRWMIVVPQDAAWEALIENNFPAFKRIRYAIRKDTVFDREKLEAMASALPDGYAFREIDGELYDLCLKDVLFEDCVSVFGSKERYLELGRGFAVMKDGKIVSAASSYSRYRNGIDIEIDTVKEERHKGLGSAVAAKLILACLDEGLYPAWDAANKMSVRLAEKLGYDFSREYVCYGIE